MISQEQINTVLDTQVIKFITSNIYEEMKDNYELPYAEDVCQVLAFDEYVRDLPDWELEEWFDADLTAEEISQIRQTIKTGTTTYLNLVHKNLFKFN
jgi:hypothetical protein